MYKNRPSLFRLFEKNYLSIGRFNWLRYSKSLIIEKYLNNTTIWILKFEIIYRYHVVTSRLYAYFGVLTHRLSSKDRFSFCYITIIWTVRLYNNRILTKKKKKIKRVRAMCMLFFCESHTKGTYGVFNEIEHAESAKMHRPPLILFSIEFTDKKKKTTPSRVQNHGSFC